MVEICSASPNVVSCWLDASCFKLNLSNPDHIVWPENTRHSLPKQHKQHAHHWIFNIAIYCRFRCSYWIEAGKFVWVTEDRFSPVLEWKCSRLNFYRLDSTKSRRRGVERRILTTHPHTHTRARTILKINDFSQRLLRTVRCTRFNDGDEHKVVSFTKEAP